MLLTTFFEKLFFWAQQIDTWLFLKINTSWANSFLDSIFPWYREANTWVPLYLFLIIFSLINFGKKAWPWILFAVITVVITDQLSSTVIKNLVERPRPCRTDILNGQMRLLLNNCSGGYSFPSSHATNHFGFAMFIFLTLRTTLGKWGWLFFIWAFTVSYGQVYVGVHYPLDVICGGLLGCAAGYLTATIYNRKIGPLTV